MPWGETGKCREDRHWVSGYGKADGEVPAPSQVLERLVLPSWPPSLSSGTVTQSCTKVLDKFSVELLGWALGLTPGLSLAGILAWSETTSAEASGAAHPGPPTLSPRLGLCPIQHC